MRHGTSADGMMAFSEPDSVTQMAWHAESVPFGGAYNPQNLPMGRL
jgi:hypothetical protein